jgi:basic membrane protein A
VARARWTALALVAALATGVAGCGGGDDSGDGDSGGARASATKIAVVVPGHDNEVDWTVQARAVVEEFPEALGVRVDIADVSRARGHDLHGVLEQVSHEGNDLVIAHDSRYADEAEAVANETRVPALVWGERHGAPQGLVSGITVQDKEGGYMAGIVAARAAITRRLGIVVVADGSPWDLETWNRTAGGFVAGARSADPHVILTYAQVGDSHSHATIRQVHDAAKRLLEDGAQMVFALGGASTVGALRAVEERSGESQYVGVVGDKAEYNRENYVLASVMWEVKPAFRAALRDLRAGSFGDHPYELTLRNRGIWLLSTGRTPADAYEAAMEAKERIEQGDLEVPATPTTEALEQMIAGRGGAASAR